jgi:hypothetical protein
MSKTRNFGVGLNIDGFRILGILGILGIPDKEYQEADWQKLQARG